MKNRTNLSPIPIPFLLHWIPDRTHTLLFVPAVLGLRILADGGTYQAVHHAL